MLARTTAAAATLAVILGATPLVAQDATPTPIPRDNVVNAPSAAAPDPVTAEKADDKADAKKTAKGDPKERAESAASRKEAEPKGGKRVTAKGKQAPSSGPMASCEEARNENGLRVVIYPVSTPNVRVAIYDRAGKEIDRDLFTPAKGAATGYARVAWGTRNTPPEKLLKGAFLISSSQKGRFFDGMLMADGGDGSFFVQAMNLSHRDEDGKRWRLRLGVERSLLCRVEDGQ